MVQALLSDILVHLEECPWILRIPSETVVPAISLFFSSLMGSEYKKPTSYDMIQGKHKDLLMLRCSLKNQAYVKISHEIEALFHFVSSLLYWPYAVIPLVIKSSWTTSEMMVCGDHLWVPQPAEFLLLWGMMFLTGRRCKKENTQKFPILQGLCIFSNLPESCCRNQSFSQVIPCLLSSTITYHHFLSIFLKKKLFWINSFSYHFKLESFFKAGLSHSLINFYTTKIRDRGGGCLACYPNLRIYIRIPSTLVKSQN